LGALSWLVDFGTDVAWADLQDVLVVVKASGYIEVRRAMEIIAQHLRVSQAAVYTYAK
jgi:predicted transcriptional regulator YheO